MRATSPTEGPRPGQASAFRDRLRRVPPLPCASAAPALLPCIARPSTSTCRYETLYAHVPPRTHASDRTIRGCRDTHRIPPAVGGNLLKVYGIRPGKIGTIPALPRPKARPGLPSPQTGRGVSHSGRILMPGLRGRGGVPPAWPAVGLYAPAQSSCSALALSFSLSLFLSLSLSLSLTFFLSHIDNQSYTQIEKYF